MHVQKSVDSSVVSSTSSASKEVVGQSCESMSGGATSMEVDEDSLAATQPTTSATSSRAIATSTLSMSPPLKEAGPDTDINFITAVNINPTAMPLADEASASKQLSQE